MALDYLPTTVIIRTVLYSVSFYINPDGFLNPIRECSGRFYIRLECIGYIMI